MSFRVLAVAPHPDDEAIGCGGSLRQHALRGDEVHALFLTSGELGLPQLERAEAWTVREREAEEAGAVLGLAGQRFLRRPDWGLAEQREDLVVAVARELDRAAPDRILVPHAGEWHPDHRAAHAAVLAAARRLGLALELIGTYELWTPLAAHDELADISAVMDDKLAAIRRYPSQLAAFDYVQAVTGLNAYRGALAGHCAYAEVFGGCGEPAGGEPVEAGLAWPEADDG